MLASTFLTAKQLGIPEIGRQALIEFHRMASSGEIPEKLYCQKAIHRKTACGTASCILGWCYVIDPKAGIALNSAWHPILQGRDPLNKLFTANARHQTLGAAAEATFRYLSTGDV